MVIIRTALHSCCSCCHIVHTGCVVLHRITRPKRQHARDVGSKPPLPQSWVPRGVMLLPLSLGLAFRHVFLLCSEVAHSPPFRFHISRLAIPSIPCYIPAIPSIPKMVFYGLVPHPDRLWSPRPRVPLFHCLGKVHVGPFSHVTTPPQWCRWIIMKAFGRNYACVPGPIALPVLSNPNSDHMAVCLVP